MLQHLGKTIRTLRKHKGITLNELASTLHVSPGYLSNLETMKTDTVSLAFLEQIQEELNLFLLSPRKQIPQTMNLIFVYNGYAKYYKNS